MREQDLRRRRVGAITRAGTLELLDELGEALLQHVVAEVHDEVVVAQEVAGDPDTVRETERSVLRDVGDARTEGRAVTDRGHDLLRCVTDDDPDLVDPGGNHVLDAVEENRLVRDRHQLLGARMRDRAQPGARPARQNQPLHR